MRVEVNGFYVPSYNIMFADGSFLRRNSNRNKYDQVTDINSATVFYSSEIGRDLETSLRGLEFRPIPAKEIRTIKILSDNELSDLE